MLWLLPTALAGLALVAAPVIVHLLTRRPAPRVAFPSVRFVIAAHAAAVRVRWPSDVALLLVRSAIVALAALATAQPVFVTRWRIAAWNARVARAVIVDTSDSMRVHDRAVAQIVAAELSSAFQAVRVDTVTLADGLVRAVRLLEAAPPARREVVVVSDFQATAFAEADLTVVTPGTGLRFVRAGELPNRREISGPLVAGWRRAAWHTQVHVTPQFTTTTWQRSNGAPDLGVTLVVPPAGDAAGATALRAASAFGAVIVPERRVRIAFPGSQGLPPDASAPRTPWIVNAALALRRTAVRATVARLAEKNGEFLVESAAPVTAVESAALIRAALVARADRVVGSEAEVRTIGDADLARWRRDPGPVDPSAWRRVERTDARWFWTVAIVLLGVESRMRGTRAGARRGEADAAAA